MSRSTPTQVFDESVTEPVWAVNWQTAPMQSNAASIADRATAVITRYVRLGSALAAVVAFVGLLVAGTAFVVGRSALDGSAESVWTVVGLLLLVGAVLPPLLASFRLFSVGRWTNQLVDEFRSLLDAGGEASTVVIETTEFTGEGGSQALVTTVMPTVGRLRTQAMQAGTARRLTDILATLMSLPWLLLLATVAILISAGAGFILLLIWIF
jgi:hypothetical protein